MKEDSLRHLLKKSGLDKITSQRELKISLDEVDACEKKLTELKEYLDTYKKEYHQNCTQGTDMMMIQSYTYIINNIRYMVEYWQKELKNSLSKAQMAAKNFHKNKEFDETIASKLKEVIALRSARLEKKNEELTNDVLTTSHYFFKKSS